MAKADLKILDCTLRDGGYINKWKWGYHNAREIIRYLTRAKTDFVEVGFLRNVDRYNPDITVCNTIEDLNKLLPSTTKETIYSAMVMRSNYDIKKLTPYAGNGIEMIRVTAHDYDIEEGMSFAKTVKNKGYKLSINPINIMGYSDEKILWIIDQVNKIQPYQFSIVDTFGSMKRRDLDRIVSLVDNNLDKNVRVALHLHENMALSCCLAQQFVDKHLNRPVAIDGSLLGMGRIPGNLPIELISDYLNDYADKSYDIDYMMDAIQNHIEPLKGNNGWGYTPAYFLSARFNLHRNYAEHYLGKGDLTHRDINHILACYDRSKATVFDKDYADQKYAEYKNNSIDDSSDFSMLREQFKGKKVLLMAPGSSIITAKEKIEEFIKKEGPVVIAVNFVPEEYQCDYAFFSNGKRFAQATHTDIKYIITSNIDADVEAYRLNYNRLSSSFAQGYNSLVMALKMLNDLGMHVVTVAGADGYNGKDKDYYNPSLRSTNKQDSNYNAAVSRAIELLGIHVEYLTKSAYK